MLVEKFDNQVDFVFPYVDDTDVNWRYLHNMYARKYATIDNYKGFTEINYSNGIQRYRDNGLLKYVFRGVNQFFPWINNVYMLVSDKRQVPEWINQHKVKIITHDQFIPKQYLPTFNANTIEMFLHKIPGLNENFIYSNDDMFILKKQFTNQWFFNNYEKLCAVTALAPRTGNKPGDILRSNAYKLLYNTTREDIIFTQQHGMVPMKKSLIEECFNKYKIIINKSISYFREPKNYNQYLWTGYAFVADKLIEHRLNIFCTILNNRNRDKVYNLNLNDYDMACINDGGVEQTDEDLLILQHKFNDYFPDKSKYEL